jgi:hypothetical protein
MRPFESSSLLSRLCAGLPVLLLTLTSATASPIVWDLKNVTFNDGAVASGFFVYDMTSQSFSDWDLVSSAGSIASGYTYVPGTSVTVANTGTCGIGFMASGNASQFLCLNTESALVAGAAPALSPSSFESYPGGVRTVVSGGLTDPPPGGGDSIPEPATFGLVLIGGILFFGLWRVRRRPV